MGKTTILNQGKKTDRPDFSIQQTRQTDVVVVVAGSYSNDINDRIVQYI